MSWNLVRGGCRRRRRTEPLLLLPSLSCLLAPGRMTCACRRGDPDDLMLVAWNASKTSRQRETETTPRARVHLSTRDGRRTTGKGKTDTTLWEADADACSSTVAATAEPARIRTGHGALCLCSVRHQSIEAQRPGSLGCLGAWAWAVVTGPVSHTCRPPAPCLCSDLAITVQGGGAGVLFLVVLVLLSQCLHFQCRRRRRVADENE